MAEVIEQTEVEAAPEVETTDAPVTVAETAPPEAETEVLTVTIEGETPAPDGEPASAETPQWVKDLRVKQRELARENAELKKRIEQSQPIPAVGAEPTLGDPDIDYDPEKFKAAYVGWLTRKQAAEAEARKAAEATQKAQADWQAKLTAFQAEKAQFAAKVPNYSELEETVSATLNPTQQGIIIHCSPMRAQIVAALGANPKQLARFASIQDPAVFSYELGKLETQLKVTPRKTAPPPETVPRGSSGVALGADAKLAELEAEAERTGDRTKVARYRRELRERKAA